MFQVTNKTAEPITVAVKLYPYAGSAKEHRVLNPGETTAVEHEWQLGAPMTQAFIGHGALEVVAPPSTEDAPDYNNMLKSELQSLCLVLEIEYDPAEKKADLVAKLDMHYGKN